MQDNYYNEFKSLDKCIKKLWNEKNKRKSIDLGIQTANEVMQILGIPNGELPVGDKALDKAFSNAKFKNQKMEGWFEKHPYFGGGRLALNHYESNDFPIESKFYQLNKSMTKARISAITQLSSNWEDNDLTMIPEYNIGIDFFLNSNANKLLLVISKRGNLRVLELSETLSNTQVEIFRKIKGCFLYDGIDPKSGSQIEYEPQRTIHKTLWNAFELSEVNKQFYLGISEHFELLCQHLWKNPPKGLDLKDVNELAKVFSSRLLGRLLFLWFLRKKGGIINDKANYFDIEELTSSDYYAYKLKDLFFNTLNTPVLNRSNNDFKTPYLNGGLFEPHENDWAEYEISFPTGWFESLYKHLNSFNFTTDESTPEYEQIAIDPEMLGRVFENLLASIVPETSSLANERNNKGAFYTPREIVDYMCKESLRTFMKTKITNIKEYEGIDKLIDMNDAEFLEHKSTGLSDLWGVRSNAIKTKLINSLNEIKILDPACGSGAFPIRMMQLLVKTLERLTAIYDDSLGAHRQAKSSEKADNYKTKLAIIRKNLYGSDIEPMAVEISRLRVWLSLVVEEGKKIEPLPNLDFNFVCANSLIPLQKEIQISMFDDNTYEEKLKKLREKYFNTHTLIGKNILREEFSSTYDKELDSESENYKRVKQLKTWNPFKIDKSADFFDSKIMFDINKFDVLIGNPPYIHFEKIKEDSKKIYKPIRYKTYEARGDIYTLFYEMGIKNLKQDGCLCYITSNKWMRAGYGENLRKYFVEHTEPKLLIDLGSGVFESATVDTNILVLKKKTYQEPTLSLTLKEDVRNTNMSKYIKENSIPIVFQKVEPWVILTPIEIGIKEKIEKYGKPLGEWSDVKINRGILTGLNEAFIINEQKRLEILRNCTNENERKRTNKIIKKVLRGKDIDSHSCKWAELYIINTHNGYHSKNNEYIGAINIEEYQSLKKYFDRYLDKLVKRSDQGQTPYNLRNCAYLEDFEIPKIIYSEIVQKPQFCLDNKAYFVEASAFLLTGPYLPYLENVLNSSIVSWAFKKIYAGGGLGDEGFRYKKRFIEKLPIPFPNKTSIDNNIFHLSTEEITYILSKLS